MGAPKRKWGKLSDMATLSKDKIAAMSVEERLALIDDLWESIKGRQNEIPSPDWHREVLEKRLAEAERNPQPGIPWVEARAKLTNKWLR
jgi:putative addiction module component (TIGR02574 family)